MTYVRARWRWVTLSVFWTYVLVSAAAGVVIR